MRSMLVCGVAAMLAALVSLEAAAPRQTPSLETLKQLAAKHLVTYAPRVSGVSIEEVQELALDSATLFLDRLVVRLSDPMLALHFVRADKQPLSEWKLEGQKRVGGVQTVGLTGVR